MKLSIIIPVYNERETIDEIINRVKNAQVLGYEKEIIIVNDGSTDGTIIKDLFLNHPKNLGKGAAIKTGLGQVTGDLVLIQDADLEYSPDDYVDLLKAYNFQNPVVYGSRNLKRENRGYLFYSFGGKLLTRFFNLLYRTKLTDINTGFKLFRTDIIKGAQLSENGFDFCEEITAKIVKMGYKIKEVPINYYPRKFSEGKKIRFRHGLSGAWTIIKYKVKEV